MRFSSINEEKLNKYYETSSFDGEFYSSMAEQVNKVNKATNTIKPISKTKLLKKELQKCAKTLQDSIHISSDLLKEIHRLGIFCS
jgi:hypothetical protein